VAARARLWAHRGRLSLDGWDRPKGDLVTAGVDVGDLVHAVRLQHCNLRPPPVALGIQKVGRERRVSRVLVLRIQLCYFECRTTSNDAQRHDAAAY